MKVRYLTVHAAAGLAGLVACLFTAAAADAQVEVTVNGSAVDISPPPIVQAGRVFVPVRGVFEQLGASVVYSNGTINATGNGRNISLQIGSTQATVNDQPQTIDVAPFIVGASTYVPLRFISEALGDSVSWDDANSIAAIDTGGGPADYFSPGTASYVDTAPPSIPVYDQPDAPEPNYIWQPGYWAWGSYGYYWVPGTWVPAPQPNYLWTPGYWAWNADGYVWNPGYWALAIGFYGGINYGCGYFGQGYDGGRWEHNVFRYNTYVTRVNTTIVRNVYIDRNVFVNESSSRVSYNGGQGGAQQRPTPEQLSVAKAHHLGMTDLQREHLKAAEQDRRLLASVNHDRPPVLAVGHPLSTSRRPAGFVPVRPVDRVNPQANVAPVHVAPARIVHPAVRVPASHPAPAANVPYHAPAANVPASHPAPAHVPAYHPPAANVPAYHPPAANVPAYHPPAANVPAYHPPAVHARVFAPAPTVRAPAARPAPALQPAPVVHPHPPVHAAPGTEKKRTD